MNEIETKICSRCGRILLLSAYSPRRDRIGKMRSDCKECHATKARQRRSDQPKKLKKVYIESNPKVCAGCGRILALSMFEKRISYGRTLHRTKCKDCRRPINSARNKRWVDAHPEKAKQRYKNYRIRNRERYLASAKRSNQKKSETGKMWEWLLKKRYGITPEDYYRLLSKQNGTCAICHKSPEEVRQKKLHVDHDHKANKVRGLLCGKCNRGIGMFSDDRYLLSEAIKYLS